MTGKHQIAVIGSDRAIDRNGRQATVFFSDSSPESGQ